MDNVFAGNVIYLALHGVGDYIATLFSSSFLLDIKFKAM